MLHLQFYPAPETRIEASMISCAERLFSDGLQENKKIETKHKINNDFIKRKLINNVIIVTSKLQLFKRSKNVSL